MDRFLKGALVVLTCLILIVMACVVGTMDGRRQMVGKPNVFFAENGEKVMDGEYCVIDINKVDQYYRHTAAEDGRFEYKLKVFSWFGGGDVERYESVLIETSEGQRETESDGFLFHTPGTVMEVKVTGITAEGVEQSMTFFVDSTALLAPPEG